MTHPFVRSLQGLAVAAICVPGQRLSAQASTATPLAPFVAQRVAVMPAQFFRADTSSPVKATEWAALRTEVDDSIGAAIAERGVGKKWAYAPDIARMAKRNTGYVSDPYALGAGGLRARTLKPEEQATRLLIDNLRSLIALGDARHALVPVELAVSKRGPQVRALLRLVLLDGRVGQVVWFADLAIETGTSFGSAEIGMLAQRVADLVAAR